MNPGKTPKNGPTKSSARGPGATASGVSILVAKFKTATSSAATSILDFTAATNTRTANKNSDLTRYSGWSRPCNDNLNNPSLARQGTDKRSKNNN